MDLSRLRLGSLRARGRRRMGLVADQSGATAVEFALLLPVLCLLLLGIIKLGVAFSNYIQLTNAAAAGGRQLSISRTKSDLPSTPYSDTVTAIQNAAPNLKASNITTVMTVNGATCATDTACKSDLDAILSPTSTDKAKVSLTFPCDLSIFSVIVTNCSLAASATGAVQ